MMIMCLHDSHLIDKPSFLSFAIALAVSVFFSTAMSGNP